MTIPSPKKWTAAEIKFNLETDNRWLYRGLLAIFKYQTADEQSSEITRHQNNVGFSGADANILTSYAKQLKATGSLSRKQIELCREKMVKYAKQLAKIANGELE